MTPIFTLHLVKHTAQHNVRLVIMEINRVHGSVIFVTQVVLHVQGQNLIAKHVHLISKEILRNGFTRMLMNVLKIVVILNGKMKLYLLHVGIVLVIANNAKNKPSAINAVQTISLMNPTKNV